ncbi:MAG: formylmethanofuran--tetrahydromethanopterin N-formyltransferase [Candidatus Lokiarchaeota archaeon]|nr:formylmethanofuran--tetrahydromethanopterin N-formyltransferase [Candidatus Lokiarchaeota archaeon]
MEINDVLIEDTYAEAFGLWCCRILVTAADDYWVKTAAKTFTGYAVSMIACDCEAGIEKYLSGDETPDGRPGASIIVFQSKKGLKKALMDRVGQCFLTCPTTSVFDNLQGEPDIDKKTDKPKIYSIGKMMKYFGDGWEKKREFKDRTLWDIPVMEGIFSIEESFGAKKGIAGGNIFIMGDTQKNTLKAAMDAVYAINKSDGIITSFPGGVCRSGSKTGSIKYSKFLHASTNHRYCPTLKDEIEDSLVPDGVNCILEIVINGMNLETLTKATGDGVRAAVKIPGIKKITSGNYGGSLGKYKIHLKDALNL